MQFNVIENIKACIIPLFEQNPPVDSLTKGPVMQKMFSSYDVIMLSVLHLGFGNEGRLPPLLQSQGATLPKSGAVYNQYKCLDFQGALAAPFYYERGLSQKGG